MIITGIDLIVRVLVLEKKKDIQASSAGSPQDVENKKVLGPLGILKAMMSSPRGVVAYSFTFCFGFIVGALDTT